MDKKFDPQHLDVLALARDAAHGHGESALAEWPRLALEQHGDTLTASAVVWQLQARALPQAGGADQIWLDIQASLQLPLQCQRCLGAVLQTVQAQRSFRFVADEATAAAMDDEVEEDLLVISRDLDALALVEDELILSLPLVPLHAVCPEAVPMSAVDPEFEEAAERPKPFEILAGLKTGAPK
jgi:uncharacterized protein